MPHFPKDTTDRNRTSPFAFTGNKFEFRSLGSTFSIAGPNIVLNTAVADELMLFADELEKTEDFKTALAQLLQRTIHEHKRIIFNGDNYAAEWVTEAEKRGLLNLKTTPDALPYFVKPENIAMFSRHGVFTETEMKSRYEILMENYAKIINIEAQTMLDMASKDILPAALTNIAELTDTMLKKKELGLTAKAETALCGKISSLADSLAEKIDALEKAECGAKSHAASAPEEAVYYRDAVIPAMNELRAVADELEMCVAKKYWPFPTYGDILFSVQ